MKKGLLSKILTTLVILLSFSSTVWGAEKLRYFLAAKAAMGYAIPALAAEEKGFWKQQGLEVELIGFRGSHEAIRAIAAKQVDMGTIETLGAILSYARGASFLLVASLNQRAVWHLWVLKDSPLKTPRELAGKRLGVTSLHDISGAYGRMLKKAQGVEFHLVGAGGLVERIATLKARGVDAILSPPGGMVPLTVKGEVRRLLRMEDYTAKPWEQYHVGARPEVAHDSPEMVKKATRAMVASVNFIRDNRRWTLDVLKARFGQSEEAALLQYEVNFQEAGGDGRTDPKGIENVRDFLVEYALIAKDKAPRVEEMYTNKFVE